MTHYRFAIFATAAVLVATAHAAWAQEPFDSKLQASKFQTKLVQAVDECVVGTTTVGGVDACAPANVTTEGVNSNFSIGSIAVKSRILSNQVMTILKSSGNGGNTLPGDNKKALGGKTVQTRLVVRITKRTTSTAPADPLTWVDQVLLCDDQVVPGSGNIVIKQQLTGALGCNLPLGLSSEQYQKEIVSASVLDAGSGKALAVPGVRKKP